MALLLLAAAPLWQPALAGIIGLAVAGVSAYFGWVNLEQAKALGRLVPGSMLDAHGGEMLTVRGKPESLYQGADPFQGNWLWFKKRFQEYRRTGHGSDSRQRWVTVRTDTASYGLAVVLENGARVEVTAKPTEVHGTESQTHGGGWGAESRVLIEFLPTKLPFLTVCGRLSPAGDGWTMVPDRKLGLLLSPRLPEAQAKWELVKGILLVAVVPLAALGISGWAILHLTGGP